MPSKEFLEDYPLYRKYKVDSLPSTLDAFPKANINMPCPICKSNQTYSMRNNYYENFKYANSPSNGAGVRLRYICTHCEKFERLFFIKIGKSRVQTVIKSIRSKATKTHIMGTNTTFSVPYHIIPQPIPNSL